MTKYVALFFFGHFLEVVAFYALWGWFLVPLGVPPITLVHAFGLILLVNLLHPYRSGEDWTVWPPLVFMGLRPIAALIGGYALHLCL